MRISAEPTQPQPPPDAPIRWAIPGVTGWDVPSEGPAGRDPAVAGDRAVRRPATGRRGPRAGPAGGPTRRDLADAILGTGSGGRDGALGGEMGSAGRRLVPGGAGQWALRARRQVSSFDGPQRGLAGGCDLVLDTVALRALVESVQAVYLRALAAADADRATERMGLGGTAAVVAEVAGVPARTVHGELALARRLFCATTQTGGLPAVGAALARGIDRTAATDLTAPEPAAGPDVGLSGSTVPAIDVAQARVIDTACHRLSAGAAAMVSHSLLAVAGRMSVDSLAVVARRARQAGLDADQPDPRPDPAPDPGAEPGRDPAADPPPDPGAEPGRDPAADPPPDPDRGAARLAAWWTARDAELRAQRMARLAVTIDGWGQLQAFLPPEDAAAWEAVLDALSAPQPGPDGARDPRSAAQRRADALGRAARILLALPDLPSRAGARPGVLVQVDLADLVAAAGAGAVRAAVAATTGGASPAYAAVVRDRRGLVPAGMIDMTVLAGARWIATRQSGPAHHPDGVPGVRATGDRILRRLLRPDRPPDRPPTRHAMGDRPRDGDRHPHELAMEITAIDSLRDLRPPSPDDPLLGDRALAESLADADPVLVHAMLRSLSPALGGDRLAVLAMGRSARTATRTQRIALAVRDRGCVQPGCTAKLTWCQADHAPAWADGGRTDLGGLQTLCGPHHRAKTAEENAGRRTRARP